MGKTLYESFESWADGVITTVESDKVPQTASPRGRNSNLVSAASGKAAAAKRRGMTTMNRTAITGSPVVHGQAQFKKRSGATFTQYHVLVSDGGRLDTMSTSGVVTSISTSAFTAGDLIPSFATANNLLFIVNGTDAKKFTGTDVQEFGIAAPGSAPTIADAGTAGAHNGTYEARVTFYNSVTGQESSAGPTSGSVAVTNKDLAWTSIPTSADPQVDSRRLYLRNTATQSQFFRVTTIADNASTTYTSDVADSALITLGPDTTENDPPPSGIFALAWYGSRMFAADSTKVYYSKLGLPESFDPDAYEQVNPDDDQAITALHPAQDVLIVFKAASMYAIEGDNPSTWTVRLVDPNIGCIAKRSIKTVEGITYWWSKQGPMRWDGANPPEPIGSTLIGATVSTDTLAFDELDRIAAEIDLSQEHIIWGVPELNQTRLTMMLPFSYRLQRWESDKWDPMDIASMTVIEDSTGQPFVMMGNYAGQIFKWWASDNDGIATGDTTGSFTASGSSMSTFTDASKTYDTTGAGLKERRVTVVDADGNQVGTTRPRITSNTATSVTVTPAVQGLINGETYTFVIGGPNFEWDTLWSDGEKPYNKKRYEYLFIQMKATTTDIAVTSEISVDYDSDPAVSKDLNFSSSEASATWDSSLWDAAITGSQATVNKRVRVGKTGNVWRVRIRNRNADEPVTLTKIGMQSELLGTNT